MRLLQPLHVHLSTLFFTLTLLVGCLIGGLGYYMSASMVQTAASEQWERMGQSVQQELRNTLEPAEMALQFLRVHRITLADSLPQRLDSLSVMSQVLKGASVISAVYVGYPNGDFFLLRRLDESDHALLDAPPAARFVVQSIAHDTEPAGYYIYLGAQGEIIQRTERQGYGNAYDPRTRGWWRQAQSAKGVVQTRPYVFYTTRSVGITLAAAAQEGGAVVGADINLATLGAFLARHKVTPSTELALVNGEGELVAHERIAALLHAGEHRGAMPQLAELRSAPWRSFSSSR